MTTRRRKKPKAVSVKPIKFKGTPWKVQRVNDRVMEPPENYSPSPFPKPHSFPRRKSSAPMNKKSYKAVVARLEVKGGSAHGNPFLGSAMTNAEVSATIPEGFATLQKIKRGIPIEEFTRTSALLGLTQEEFGRKIGISIPTLTRRRKISAPLDPEHSDRLVRFQRLFAQATDLFEGNKEAARRWLSAEQLALGYAIPLDIAETEAGAREVEKIIGRLDYGEIT